MSPSRMRLSRPASSMPVWRPAGGMLRAVLGYPSAPQDIDGIDDMSPFAIRVTSDVDDPMLADAWQQLADDGRASVFQSHVWQKGLVEHFLKPQGITPYIVAVSDAETWQPLAILPLQRTQSKGIRRIDTLGHAFCDTAMPLLAAGFEPDEATTEALLEAVIAALPAADILSLTKMPKTFYGTRNPFAALAGCHSTADMTFPVELDAFKPGFVGATSAYKTYQKQWRKLTRRDGIAFEIFAEPGDIARAFDAMIAMRNSRFDALSRDDLLDDPNVAAFYREMALKPKSERVVTMTGLKVGDAYTAYIYMMNNGKRLSTVISAIDNTVGNAYAPGLILFTKIFERAVEMDYEAADIGIGHMHYKTRFAPSPSPLVALDRGLTLKGKAIVGLQSAKRGLKSWAKDNAFVRRIAEKFLKRRVAKPVETAKPTAEEE